MANAFKCDRCGALYECYRGKQLTEGGNFYNGILLESDLAIFARHFDLCPDCMEQLIQFIKTEEAHER